TRGLATRSSHEPGLPLKWGGLRGESERATDPAVTPGEEGRTLESRVLGNLASPVRRGESGNLHRARRPAPTQRAAWARRTHPRPATRAPHPPAPRRRRGPDRQLMRPGPRPPPPPPPHSPPLRSPPPPAVTRHLVRPPHPQPGLAPPHTTPSDHPRRRPATP